MRKLLVSGIILVLVIFSYILTKENPLAYVTKHVEKEEQTQIVWDSDYNKYLVEPIDVAIWGRYIFVTDVGKRAVMRIDVKTGKGELVASKELKFQYPYGLLVVDDILYVSDCTAKSIQAYDLSSERVLGIFYSGNDGTKPGFMTADQDKNIWFSDLQFKRVVKISPKGKVVDCVGEGLLLHPQGITLFDQAILVADEAQGCVYKISTETKQLSKFIEMPGRLSLIRDLASQDNILYLTKPLAGALDSYDLMGRCIGERDITTFERARGIPMGVTSLPQGGALVVDRANACLQTVLP